jgi:hypothetical protein
MPLAKLSEKQADQLARFVSSYIAAQQAAFGQRAQPIPAELIPQLDRFFPAEVLSTVQVVRGRAAQPGFYRLARMTGIGHAPAFSEMAGITFEDVVVHAEPLSLALLFHELAHALQYRHLGLDGFRSRQVRGCLSGGSYEQIPLEKQAYELEQRFASNPSPAFSVEDDVQQRIRLHQL